MSDLKRKVSLFMLKYLLPLPVVRRSYKLRLYTELTQIKYKQDKPMPPEVSDVQFIGSQYEGLSVTVTSVDGGDAIYAMSDYDTMPILKHYQARDRDLADEDFKADENKEVHFLEIYDASHPGYCRLKSTITGKFVGMRFNEDCSGDVNIYHDGVKIAKMNVPYTEVIPGFFEKPDTIEIKKYVHGPAISCTKIQVHPGNITRTGQEVDVVLSIKCQSWPLVAAEWIKRLESKTSDWPNRETIEKVKSTGCFVVAVPHTLSPNPNEEWRYSFAPVEKILARSFTFAQRGSYIIAKMLFKTALQNIDKVSSYCLKTQMFWLCEEESSSAWSYDQVGYYALEVLSKLAENLKIGVLRNYIIPENNIISHIPASTLQEASKTLLELVCNPFPVLEKIRRTTKYFGIILHPPEESFLPLSELLEQQIADDSGIKRRFHASKLAIMEHYCSMLKKPIVNIVQEEFSKLKFALLMDIAEDTGNDSDSAETVDDMIARIANELSNYSEENVKRWYAYVEEYWKSVDNIKSENVEQMLTNTYDGILKVEAF
ncbi:uncharacterized protein LOC128555721 [Mercenaria mercenaria]|uniref:uncharacterized protein LOC128555721 n=1 Tax=Mercenaria mercenaria TaxID=6596 RepID=UPI00234F3852|nr:uncharacterized protein LOC128555721 [Mercenaria mercenaria]